jgi:hypothetical protein
MVLRVESTFWTLLALLCAKCVRTKAAAGSARRKYDDVKEKKRRRHARSSAESQVNIGRGEINGLKSKSALSSEPACGAKRHLWCA